VSAPADSPPVYQPQDALTLWWLADPSRPRLVGTVRLVMGHQSVGFQYAPEWLATGGHALSQDLPLRGDLLIPARKGEVVGAIDDARPDRWGERVIRRFEKTQRLSLLEYLLFAGDDRYGALGVSTRPDVYEPWPTAPVATLADLQEMNEVVRKVLANEPVPEIQRRLVRPGVSLGGARPKSLLAIDGEPWLVKFSEGEDMDTELVEHASMTLAATCGIETAVTRALPVPGRHAVAVRRFDRVGPMRVHALSAFVALRAAGEELGYPQLAQLLRRLAPAAEIARQQEQLFRRMVFNILIDNTDDHEKNHALLRRPDGAYALAPAFDVLPAAQGLRVQSMQVGSAGTESTIENALSQVGAFGLRRARAEEIVHAVASAVEGWKDHFRQTGVTDSDIDVLAQYIDGDHLGGQRAAVLRRRGDQ
jgi:serine/threonine-protein kinase HipA